MQNECGRFDTNEEVKEMVSKYGDTALRAKKCGFDGVEIGNGKAILNSLSSDSLRAE